MKVLCEGFQGVDDELDMTGGRLWLAKVERLKCVERLDRATPARFYERFVVFDSEVTFKPDKLCIGHFDKSVR